MGIRLCAVMVGLVALLCGLLRSSLGKLKVRACLMVSELRVAGC
jgi:hypothetical protein